MTFSKNKTKGEEDQTFQKSDSILYFKDDFAIAAFNREADNAIQSARSLLGQYQLVSGYQIRTISDLHSLAVNPEMFYKDQHIAENQGKLADLINLKVNFTIDLPSDWDSVLNAIKRFAKHNTYTVSAKHFVEQGLLMIDTNQIKLTDKFYERRNARCCHYATSPDEKDRLQFCNGVIAAIEKLKPRLERNQKLYSKALQECLWYYPLPYFLRSVKTMKGTIIIPNPSFISEEFGGTNHMGRLISTKAEERRARLDAMPKLGEQWVRFRRPLAGGERKLFMCKQSEVEKYITPLDELLPGFVNEFEEPWGTPIDRTRSKPTKEAFYNPLTTIK